MARNFFRIFTENNPVMGSGKKYIKPDAKGLKASFELSNFLHKSLKKRVVNAFPMSLFMIFGASPCKVCVVYVRITSHSTNWIVTIKVIHGCNAGTTKVKGHMFLKVVFVKVAL